MGEDVQEGDIARDDARAGCKELGGLLLSLLLLKLAAQKCFGGCQLQGGWADIVEEEAILWI